MSSMISGVSFVVIEVVISPLLNMASQLHVHLHTYM